MDKQIENPSITIGDNDYVVSEQTPEVQMLIQRADELSADANKLNMNLNELTALISMYQAKVVDILEPKEDPEAQPSK